jgi:hypothetical protein
MRNEQELLTDWLRRMNASGLAYMPRVRWQAGAAVDAF